MPEDKVIIFDTTLRDGEQAAGAAMAMEEKLEIANQLDRLGVDVIEAGFPISSPGDFQAVKAIAATVRRPIICALAHANSAAVDRAWESVKEASHPRIHVFLSTSDIHIMHQLRKGREEVMDMAVSNVELAKSYCEDVEFSPMDATRTEPEYLYAMLRACIRAGATTVNIPDTVGYTTPGEFSELLKGIQANVEGIQNVTLSVHCHNDLGLAVSNSLAAVKAGARQVEGCINGIGERAGNAALEEVIMSLHTRRDYFQVGHSINTSQLYRTSKLVRDITGFAVQPNKAVVGGNAFRHASGIHQDGIIKERTTYEVMDPQDIGWPSNELVLGKLSGRHGLKSRLEELGYQPSDAELTRIFEAFKELADKKREVTDRDLESLMSGQRRSFDEVYTLDHVQVSCGSHEVPTATVRLIAPGGEVKTEAATGTGPVDAIYQAISRIVQVPNKLAEFSVSSVTEGIDAVGEVTIRIEVNDQGYVGRGADTDIIVASAKAYMNALNRLLSMGDVYKSAATAAPL